MKRAVVFFLVAAFATEGCRRYNRIAINHRQGGGDTGKGAVADIDKRAIGNHVWVGGSTGKGTMGLGNIDAMGHDSGTGTGQGDGSGAGRGVRGRGWTKTRVRATPASVTGLLSPEAIRRVVHENLGHVTQCHEQALAQNPNLQGRVVIRFVIGGDGTVMDSNVAESSLPDPSLAQCIANAVRRWRFPAPQGGGIVTVNYPFALLPPD